MAKNVVKKKQRIAHNKMMNEDHRVYSECDDFLTNIIQGMDKNDLLSVMDFNKFDTNFLESNKTSIEKTQSDSIPTSKQSRSHIQKSKTFGLCRKFPLMEKSQRALKQIRHNRKIPKPRAHLAGLSNPLLENNLQSFDANSILIEKPKKTKVVARDSNKFQNKKATEKLSCHKVSSQASTVKKNPEKIAEKIVHKKHELPVTDKNCNNKESTHLVKNTTKNAKSVMEKKGSFKEQSRLEKNEYDKTGGNSTDSEQFERFIRKEKKTLPKKSKNQKDTRKRRKKASKKHVSKTKSKIVSETDSDQSEEESESYYKNKRRKRSHKVVNNKLSNTAIEDSESEMDVIDETYHDSSSDSDELVPLSQIIDNSQSNNFTCNSQHSRQIDTEHNSTPELNSSHKNLAVISSVSSDQSNIACSIVNNNSKIVPHETSSISSVSNTVQSVSHETPGNASLMENVKLASDLILLGNHSNVLCKTSSIDKPNISCSISQNDSILSNSSKQENSNKSLIVDLTESDNEVENSFTVMPKIVMTSSQTQNESLEHSEESDIELVDVIVPELQKKVKRLNKNTRPSFSNDNTNELSIKVENVSQTPPPCKRSVKPFKELHTSRIVNNIQSKCEIPNTTDIKQGYNKNEFKNTTKPLNLNNDKLQSSLSSNEESSFVLSKVKKEPCDCEIILDTVSTNNSSQKLPDIQICSDKSIKIEKDSKTVKQTSVVHIDDDDYITTSKNKLGEKEQKLHEVAHSNLKNLMNMHNTNLSSLGEEKISELNSIDIKAALQSLKKEFATYQEILQTEQSVGATFKMLERCQAEKLKSLKTKITQCLDSHPVNSDNFNTIKNAMNKLLSSSELVVCPGKNIPKSDISVQNLKDGNLVPLSSISANDIKPDLSELQHTIKKEASTSNEISMSFGQKCIVCAKVAAAACQQCAKVFFCSNECGKKYWEDGHKDSCKTYA